MFFQGLKTHFENLVTLQLRHTRPSNNDVYNAFLGMKVKIM